MRWINERTYSRRKSTIRYYKKDMLSTEKLSEMNENYSNVSQLELIVKRYLI